jgi:hypothetical protein
MTPANPNRSKKSLFHNLGEFFGHIAHGIKSDPPAAPSGALRLPQVGANPAAPAPPPSGQVVRQETQERQVLTPQGKLVLRRTIIDEVRRADEPS